MVHSTLAQMCGHLQIIRHMWQLLSTLKRVVSQFQCCLISSELHNPHSRINLAAAFEKILDNFGILEKVSVQLWCHFESTYLCV